MLAKLEGEEKDCQNIVRWGISSITFEALGLSSLLLLLHGTQPQGDKGRIARVTFHVASFLGRPLLDISNALAWACGPALWNTGSNPTSLL